ncbi:DUF2071 domain-containing protein [Dokdonia sinensis]|uniref:DUF2071 domain-containing protein n=1 Tax=Dokdonia sinensis TaxID=2479847 RepID=A0A3M0FUT7_9FLAO|nr:DUF2071 domain-containing protein [Dokdonia sinensis]RMB56255.1 DUF2071 domain-containing protein [Dokdonia sinensis]
MSFLTAAWRKLALANYAVDPEILREYLPYGTELDLWQGKCYVSLVGFMFLNTRVLGIKIPYHVNFEEVNLRFYVRHKHNGIWKRGVVFINETVPKNAIVWVANTLYGENYTCAKMSHKWRETSDHRSVTYRWEKTGDWQEFSVQAGKNIQPIPKNSEAEFICEHYWGYARVNETKTNEYEVTHPKWEQYAVQDYNIDVDFGHVYGSEFAFLNEQQPTSVILAEGAPTTIEGKRVIRK